MKLRSALAVLLVLATLFTAGCSKEEEIRDVYTSPNFTFAEDMALYMVAYTRNMLKGEMSAAGVDTSKPLSEQEKSEGVTWEDYLYEKSVDGIEDILYYCEAALEDGYTIGEGMIYKAQETVSYITANAQEAGMTAEEFIREAYGEAVTLDALNLCTQMMCLCEGYELHLTDSFEVTEEEALAFAEENPDRLLKFDALRYTTEDKDVADKLSAAADREEFLKIMSGVSGTDRTDSDKNGIPDALEIKGAVVATDITGEFAKEEGRAAGDTVVNETDGKYTVTMLLSLPARKYDPLWNFRMIYISSEASTDPAGDAASLLDQWKEKEGGEEGFSNLAARYSDDPTAYYGGLFYGTSVSEMPTADIAAWVCDGSRTEGDTTVLPAGDGAYMLYYISGNTERWYHEAVNMIKSDKTEARIDSIKEDLKDEIVLDEPLMLKIVREYLAEE